MMLRRLLLSSIFGLTLAFAGTSTAGAHAFLDHAAPAVGSTLQVPPPQVRLWFSEQIEPAFSTIEVTDDKGQRVEQGRAAVDPSNVVILQVALKPLPPGTYKVVWRVVSVDTHRTEGNFTFTVSP